MRAPRVQRYRAFPCSSLACISSTHVFPLNVTAHVTQPLTPNSSKAATPSTPSSLSLKSNSCKVVFLAFKVVANVFPASLPMLLLLRSSASSAVFCSRACPSKTSVTKAAFRGQSLTWCYLGHRYDRCIFRASLPKGELFNGTGYLPGRQSIAI